MMSFAKDARVYNVEWPYLEKHVERMSILLTQPRCFCVLSDKGRVVLTGCKTVQDARKGARQITRLVWHLVDRVGH